MSRLGGWAADHQISPGTLHAISLLLALCAAIWLSGGSPDRGPGLIALSGSVLAMVVGGRVADYLATGGVRPGTAGRRRADDDKSTDWLALPGVTFDVKPGVDAFAVSADRATGQIQRDDQDDVVVAVGQAPGGATAPNWVVNGRLGAVGQPEAAQAEEKAPAAVGNYEWVAAVCALAGECAVYGGMAAGGIPGRTAVLWPLAVLTIVSAGTADLLGACRVAGPGGGLSGPGAPSSGRAPSGRASWSGRTPSGRGSPSGTWADRLPALPRGARLGLAGLVFALAGPQAALFAVVGLAVLATTWTVVRLGRIAPAPAGGRRARARASGAGPGTGGDARGQSGTAAAWAALATDEGTSDQPIAVGGLAGEAHSDRKGPVWPFGSESTWGSDARAGVGGSQAGGGESEAAVGTGLAAAGDSAMMTDVLALRDDGDAALWAGRLVQGNLIPLPPALAGLIATAMLATLGLHDLRGLVAITPPIVMMLAAPGSSHPHDGRFDWLVPALLALAQYVYLGALGFAVAVPGPYILSACALTALWYASLAAGGDAGNRAETAGRRTRGYRAGVGWEVRLFLIGLAVAFGLGTFGYLGLAAYLGVLLCRQAVSRYLTRTEGERQ